LGVVKKGVEIVKDVCRLIKPEPWWTPQLRFSTEPSERIQESPEALGSIASASKV
jgi:hypothetical protein